MQLIVITGLSGAGKGLATRHFEDFGYFCVDNLPPMLIGSFAELLERGKIGKAALVVDVRGGEFFSELMGALDALEQSPLDLKILFLDCDDDALIKRFKETRRKHPLDGDDAGLPAAIERERELLSGLRARADKAINTSRVTPRELRDELQRTFVDEDDAPGMLIQVESFGFKHGPHAGADLVFDVRFLPNPNYDRDIGHLDGFCQPIIDYVLSPDITQEFLRRWEDFLLFLVPQFEAEGKAYLTIAVGCTGGRHRSVALTNWLAARLESAGYRVAASHRDLAAHAPRDLGEASNSALSSGGDAPNGASLGRAQNGQSHGQIQTFEAPSVRADGDNLDGGNLDNLKLGGAAQ